MGKIYLLIYVFLSTPIMSFGSSNFSNCLLPFTFELSIKLIQENSKTRDVEPDIEKLKTRAKVLCEFDEQGQLNLDTILETNLKRGYRSQIQKDLDDANRIIKYRTPSQQITNIDRLSNLLGKSRSDYL